MTVVDHPTADHPAVVVEGLRKTYGRTRAVDGVSFTVAQGEIFGILGPNGAGKTTAVECIAGLRDADAGRVRVLGLDPQHGPDVARVREILGVQLQESRLPPKLRVHEALELYAALYANPDDPERLLALLGLEDRRSTAYQDLSGGQKQRLSIALALVGRPRVAILDELTTGLDPQARRETWDLVERVRADGVTIILVTHFMDEAERLCDRLVIIDEGVVVAEGTPAQLTGAHVGAERGFVMSLPAPAEGHPPLDLAVLMALPEVATVSARGDEIEVTGSREVLPAVVAALHARGLVPDELRTRTRTLEDVFVDLVTHPDARPGHDLQGPAASDAHDEVTS